MDTAIIAKFAHLPLKWRADVRERGAEWSFCVGGMLADYRRNDTSAADGSADATARKLPVQLWRM